MSRSMHEIFAKLNDLSRIFQFAEKIVPIIQSLIEFMQEMTPLLENINSSIADSTNQMKRGTDQISDVTSATEMATTEILDLVDETAAILVEIENVAKTTAEKITTKNDLIEKVIPLVADNKEATELLKQYQAEHVDHNSLETILGLLAKVNENSYKITLSLQVQDITAQQLASVNHLIESVQTRLGSLINDIDQTNISEQVEELRHIAPEGVAFDPNASYTNKEGKQEKVDDIINESKNQEKASQDEIDKLFS